MKRTGVLLLIPLLCGCPEPPPTETQQYATVTIDDVNAIDEVMNGWIKNHPDKTLTSFSLDIQFDTVKSCMVKHEPGSNAHQRFATIELPKNAKEDIETLQELSNDQTVYDFQFLPKTSDKRYLLVCLHVTEEKKPE